MSLNISLIIYGFIGIGVVIAGAVVGYFLATKRGAGLLASVEAEAAALKAAATDEADAVRRKAELEAKESLLEAKAKAEQATQARLEKLQAEHAEVIKREADLERSEEALHRDQEQQGRAEAKLAQREEAAEVMARKANEMLASAEARLQALSQMSSEEARALLMDQVKDEARQAAAKEIKAIFDEAEREVRARATTIIAAAIQRQASEHVSERTVSVVQLPSDEMKGRIIGREGRNIRALEAATGVDIIIDDTPEAVIISCFNPLRREIGRMTLSRLLADGRIHPSRIEEVMNRATKEVAAACKQAGEQAVFDLGLHRVHPELVRLLGELRFRSSYAQNVLQHVVEVGHLAGVIAAELGINVKMARRAGLLHDIGKAVSQEMEGSHAAVGASLARKYGENAKIVHAIEAHHGEVEAETVLAHVVDTANRLSAQRPGARRDQLASYIQRLHDLEAICTAHEGVIRAHAIQAGRDLRVVVENSQISDEMAVVLSREIATEVEESLAYPAQIKVSVIRESRASATAR